MLLLLSLCISNGDGTRKPTLMIIQFSLGVRGDAVG